MFFIFTIFYLYRTYSRENKQIYKTEYKAGDGSSWIISTKLPCVYFQRFSIIHERKPADIYFQPNLLKGVYNLVLKPNPARHANTKKK